MEESMNVYLLEDDIDDAMLISRYLRESSYEVASYRSVRDIIEAISSKRPDIILADMNVCDSRGVKTLSSLCEVSGEIPIVATSGYHQFEQINLLANYGIFSFIDKEMLTSSYLKRELDFARERCKLERKIREASSNKSMFISRLSHEIRNPLNVVLGMSSLLQDDTPRDQQKEIIEAIQLSSQRILSIVNDVLDLSKIEAGENELKIERFNIRQLIQESFRFFKQQAQLEHMLLIDHISPQVPVEIESDPGKIRQILDNFVSNAIKYSKSEMILVEMQPTSAMDFMIQVKDFGVGIPEAMIETIFSPFTQCKPEHGKQGSGLGLTICKRFAYLMEGNVGVESRSGEGACFWFSFKVNKSHFKLQARSSFTDVPALICLQNTKLAELLAQQLVARRLKIDILSPEQLGHLSQETWQRYAIQFIGTEIPSADKNSKTLVRVYESTDQRPLNGETYQLVSPFCQSRTLSITESVLKGIGYDSNPKRNQPDSLPKLNRNTKVLVVDDEGLNRKMLIKILKSLGIDAQEAPNGRQAVALVREIKGRLIIFMDCSMPEMDGFEASRQIKAIRPDSVIVALTGLTYAHETTRCRDCGMDCVLHKPIQRTDILNLLNIIVDSDSSIAV